MDLPFEPDPLLHAPARLKVMMLLASGTTWTFNALAKETGLTPGNLQSHLKALEAGGYVEARRALIDLKPRMRYALTAEGRAALLRYCRALEETIRRIQGTLAPEDTAPASGTQGLSRAR